MNEQLNQAYSLIKEGQTQAAIDILEPLIRSDRDNEDAWWLLANASSEPAAKRNALNNVMRLSENESRKNKARVMLQQLDDDPFDFDSEQAPKVGMSSYQALDDAPQKKSSGFSCATIALIIVGLIGACGMFSCIGLLGAAGGIFQAVSYPASTDGMALLESNTEITGDINLDAPRDGYLYEGESGDEIRIAVTYDALLSPTIVIFSEDRTAPPIFTTPASNGEAIVTYTLPESGTYIITINAYKFIGQEVGFGEYTLEFEVR